MDVVSESTSVPVLGSADPIPESMMRSRRKVLAELWVRIDSRLDCVTLSMKNDSTQFCALVPFQS